MSETKILRHLLMVAVVSCGLASCEGGELGGNLSSDSNQQSSSASDNQPLADLTFADAGLTECVMATGKAMSDEVTELACGQTISHLGGVEQLQNLRDVELKSLAAEEISFSSLKRLENLLLSGSPYGNGVKSIDISRNPSLQSVEFSNVDVVSLDFSNNYLLDNITVESHSLSRIDLPAAGESQLRGLSIYTGSADELLVNFTEQNMLKTLNIRGRLSSIYNLPLAQLERLNLSSFFGESLVLSAAVQLKSLSVESSVLKSIILPKDALEAIHLNAAALESLDLSQQKNLHLLDLIFNNNLELRLPDESSLLNIKIVSEGLSTLDLSRSNQLVELHIDAPLLESVSVPSFQFLESIRFYSPASGLQLINTPALVEADLKLSGDSSLNFSESYLLNTLYIDMHSTFSFLDVVDLKNLKRVSLEGGGVEEQAVLDFSGNDNLESVWIENISVTDIKFGDNGKLDSLALSRLGNIENLSFPEDLPLSSLTLSDFSIDVLDIFELKNLKNFNMSNMHIENILFRGADYYDYLTGEFYNAVIPCDFYNELEKFPGQIFLYFFECLP